MTRWDLNRSTPPLRQWAAVTSLFPLLAPQRYGRPTQVPTAMLGVDIGQERITCSPMTAWTLASVFHKSLSLDQWNRWQVNPRTPRYSCGVAEELGIGERWHGLPERCVYLCHYERGDGTGHDMLVLDYHAESGRFLTLEANCAHKVNGVGWRGIGNLRSSKPTATWYTSPAVPTWDTISRYPEVCLTRLRIDHSGVLSWLSS